MCLEENNDSYINDCHEVVATGMADNVHAVQRDKDW